MHPLWLLPVFLLTSTWALAETYRWLDEQGNIHFSDKPPLSQEAENISAQLKQPNIDQGGRTATEQLQQRRNARSARQVEQQQQNKLHSPYQQRRAKACREARRKLSILQGRVIFFDDQGKDIKVTEQERAKRAVEFETLVKNNCDETPLIELPGEQP